MNTERQVLFDYCVGLADDSLILGHRLSEWCRNGPFLEEDLALTNVALDFIGRARMFYQYAAKLEAKGRSEDDIAYSRDCRDYRNLLINELPIGDFAFTMARQLMVDVYDLEFFTALSGSKDTMLAAIASKAVKESSYHLRRSEDWIKRLGDGTGESHERVQNAFDQLWAYSSELFDMSPDEQQLANAEIAVNRKGLKQDWTSKMHAILHESTLEIPNEQLTIVGGRQGLHTEHLGFLLAEMQSLQRSYPGQQW